MAVQDLTRSFAGESKDTEKFALYMAATHFSETIQNLVDAQNLVDEMQAILHKQSSVFDVCLTLSELLLFWLTEASVTGNILLCNPLPHLFVAACHVSPCSGNTHAQQAGTACNHMSHHA